MILTSAYILFYPKFLEVEEYTSFSNDVYFVFTILDYLLLIALFFAIGVHVDMLGLLLMMAFLIAAYVLKNAYEDFRPQWFRFRRNQIKALRSDSSPELKQDADYYYNGINSRPKSIRLADEWSDAVDFNWGLFTALYIGALVGVFI